MNPYIGTNSKEVYLQKIYENISKFYKIGTYQEFESAIVNPEYRKNLYNQIVVNASIAELKKMQISSFQEFENKLEGIEDTVHNIIDQSGISISEAGYSLKKALKLTLINITFSVLNIIIGSLCFANNNLEIGWIISISMTIVMIIITYKIFKSLYDTANHLISAGEELGKK